MIFWNARPIILHLLKYCCSLNYENLVKDRIPIDKISTMGYIKLTNSFKNFKQSLKYDKHLKCFVDQYLSKCFDIINPTIEKLEKDMRKPPKNKDEKLIFANDFVERVILTCENTEKEIDNIYKNNNNGFSEVLENLWLSYNKMYLLKTKNEYRRLAHKEIDFSGGFSYNKSIRLARYILSEFTKCYLKRAVFMAAMFFNDKEETLEFLTCDISSNIFKKSNEECPSLDSCAYKAIKFIAKKYKNIETIKEISSSDEISDTVVELLQNVFYNGRKMRKKSINMFMDGFPTDFYLCPYSTYEFKATGKIKNLVPTFKRYIECLSKKENPLKGINMIFFEINLTKEMNEALENIDYKYKDLFKRELWSFLETYKEFRLLNNIKILFVWREVKISASCDILKTISKSETIESDEINRIKFFKEILSIYDDFQRECLDILFYKGFNEPDEHICEDTYESRDRFLEKIFYNNEDQNKIRT